MKFYNREQELELLTNISMNAGFKLVVIYGRRRIGKTRLVREFLKDKDFAYIFVPRYKTKDLFFEEISQNPGIPRFTAVYDLVKYLFDTKKYVFFDEFQNFYYIDKGIYSDFQQLIDEYKTMEKDTKVFISGSSFSLMKKTFVDYADPLYGRADVLLKLPPFDLNTVRTILVDNNIKSKEELIQYYAVFGGIPKYYEFLDMPKASSFAELVRILFFEERMPLLKDEGRTVLASEFGGEYRAYFSILEAIAGGRSTVADIADIFEGKGNTVSKYLDTLRKEYEVVVRETPITEDPRKSRSGIYKIRDPFLRFWFAFVERYESYYEQDRTTELFKFFNKNFDTFVGFAFEDMAKGFLEKNSNLLPFPFEKIGRQWGRIRDAPKGKNTYEIDIVALNDDTKEILFVECKWKDINESGAEKILADLKQKSRFVQWNNDDRKEHFGLVARKIKGKERLREKGLVVFDLDDL